MCELSLDAAGLTRPAAVATILATRYPDHPCLPEAVGEALSALDRGETAHRAIQAGEWVLA